METTKRTHVDDAAAGGAEMRQSLARDEKRATRVGFEGRVPLVEGHAFEGGGRKDGCVVDEDIELAECSHDLSKGSADGGLGAHLAGYGE